MTIMLITSYIRFDSVEMYKQAHMTISHCCTKLINNITATSVWKMCLVFTYHISTNITIYIFRLNMYPLFENKLPAPMHVDMLHIIIKYAKLIILDYGKSDSLQGATSLF